MFLRKDIKIYHYNSENCQSVKTQYFTLRLCIYFKHIFRRYIHFPLLPNREFLLQSAWRYPSPCWNTMMSELVVAYFTAEQSWLNSSNGFSHFSLPHSPPNPYARCVSTI